MQTLAHDKPVPVDWIIAFEEGELDEDHVLELFSHLIRNGQAWSLQGFYGRTAMGLIDAGYLDREGNRLDRDGDDS